MHVSLRLLLLLLSDSSIIVLQRHAQAGRGVQWRRAPGDPCSAFQFAGCQVTKKKKRKIWESMQLSVQQWPVSFTIQYVSCILWFKALWMFLFLFAFTHHFTQVFSHFLWLSLLCCFLFTFIFMLLKAVFFSVSDSPGRLFIFVSLTPETPHPYPAHIRSHSSDSASGKEGRWK